MITSCIYKEKLPVDYIGSKIEAICVPSAILYPKGRSFLTMNVGDWSILSVNIKELKKGFIPQEYACLSGSPFHKEYSIVIKGNIPELVSNKIYFLECDVDWDEKYGLQYKIVQMNECIDLTDPRQIRLFLEGILGFYITDILYNNFKDPCELLKSKDIKTLCTARGIGEQKAIEAISKYHSNINNIKYFIKLKEEYGLTDNQIKRLQRFYGSTDIIVKKITENPYSLIAVDGFGWKKVDDLALRIGYEPLGAERIKACTEYCLNNEAENNGNTWIYVKDLDLQVQEIIEGLDKQSFHTLLKDWIGYGEDLSTQWLYYDRENKRISTLANRQLEENICSEIFRIKNAPVRQYNKDVFDKILSDCEAQNNWEYTDEQRVAIEGCLDNNIVIVTGSGGTGKSSIMLPITRFLRANGLTFEQCSLAGKAASNLSEITDEDGKTIHRLLGVDQDTGKFSSNKDNPILTDLVIIDEMSMNNNFIFYSLIQAVRSGSKIIMLGDTNQLEPIGSGNLLKDMIESGVVPCYHLTKIMRQAAKSGIITESLKVADGVHIVKNVPQTDTRGELQDLRIVTYSEPAQSFETFMKEYKSLLSKGVSANDILGVVPARERGSISCLTLNNAIQAIVNDDIMAPSINVNNYTLRLGDKVVNRKNHYDTVKKIDGSEEPIYNGNVGYITEINSNNIVVNFKQQGEIIVDPEYWQDIMLGYVLTCHSAQGSQSPYVVVGLDTSAYVLLSKEWLYTALSRAKKYCVLCGQVKAIRIATTTSKVSKKQTWLNELLLNYKEDV